MELVAAMWRQDRLRGLELAALAAAEQERPPTDATMKRLTTFARYGARIDKDMAKAQQAHAPKAAKGNADLKILYGAQVGVAPPAFVISLNHPVELHFYYKRYLENQIRKAFGFEGTPIFLKVRSRRH